MKFSDAFFSTDKILYPIISSICFGAILLIITSFFDIKIEEIEIQIFMGIGFLIGNYIKSNKLMAEENKQTHTKKRIKE